MKGLVAVLDQVAPGQGAAALLRDGSLVDLLVDPREGDDTPRPGEIHRAVLVRPLKGLGGAIAKLGNGQAGFLRETKGLQPGTKLLVQVSTHAEPGKAPPVTTRLLFKSRYAIVTPGKPGINVARRIRDDDERDRLLEIAHDTFAPEDGGSGLILRSVCEGASAQDIADDIAALHDASETILAAADEEGPALLLDAPNAATLAWREWSDPDPDTVVEEEGAFDRMGIWDQLEALRGPRTALSDNGWMKIEPTSALVAVDVNTGGDFSPAAALKANFAAMRELPRQLRLRGLGGQVTVDFAPLSKKDRRQVEQALTAALKTDPVDTSIAGWTPLGHLELLRKRERRPLSEVLPA